MMHPVSEFRAYVRVEERGGKIAPSRIVRDHFERYGAVTDVYNPPKTPDISYVSFASQEELESALLENSTVIHGVSCSVEKALPRGDRGGAQPAGTQTAPAAVIGASPDRIYVTGLAEAVSEESLWSSFGQYGNVHDVYIPVDRSTGARKPFAFVTMTSHEEVAAILDVPNHVTLDGHPIRCSTAEPRGMPAGVGGEASGYGGNHFGGKGGSHFGEKGGHAYLAPRYGAHLASSYASGKSAHAAYATGKSGHGSRPVAPAYSAPVAPAYSAVSAPLQGVPGDYRIFVFGMPEGLNADMLRGHFARHGEILDIYVPANKPDIAYITFSAAVELQDALHNSGLRIAGFWVEGVKAAEPRAKGRGKGDRASPYSYGK